jgi:hypothetical protein
LISLPFLNPGRSTTDENTMQKAKKNMKTKYPKYNKNIKKIIFKRLRAAQYKNRIPTVTKINFCDTSMKKSHFANSQFHHHINEEPICYCLHGYKSILSYIIKHTRQRETI